MFDNGWSDATNTLAPNPSSVCPCCGYCSHCGRGGIHSSPHSYPYYPQYPYWNYPMSIPSPFTVTTTNADYSSMGYPSVVTSGLAGTHGVSNEIAGWQG